MELKEPIEWIYPPDRPQGVLVASDSGSEWMLPFWWHHYAKYNTYPVVFVDFGMSPAKIEWCRQRGEVVPFAFISWNPTPREHIDPKLVELWESIHLPEYLWPARRAWLKKPFAMLHSPFEKTIWTDLDCEVCSSLEPIFAYAYRDKLGLTPEPARTHGALRARGMIREDQTVYNAGVIPFAHQNIYLTEWVKEVAAKEHATMGDQHLLWNLILTRHWTIVDMPAIYNWRMVDGINPNAVVIHYVANPGKAHIKSFLTLIKDK